MPGILVVEDDENLNRGITFSLKKSGSGKQEAALRNLITRSVKDHAESTQCLF